MKINEGLYVCDWDGTEINAHVGKWQSSPNTAMPWTVKGKKNVSSQLKCPNCHRYVSQKLKVEMHGKNR
jgi:hypothetical protein